MRNLFIITVLLSTISAQKSIQANSISNDQIGMSLGMFLNIGTLETEVDGYIEFQSRSGFFIESSAITQFSDYNAVNSSIGFMEEFLPKKFFGGGYSNYYEINGSSLDEAFLSYRSKSMTAILFFGLSEQVSPNYLGILNLNSLVSNIPFDCSMIGIVSENINELGYDFFLNFSKTLKSGFTFGVSTSYERFETEETFAITKQGNEKSFIVSALDQGPFISLFLGWIY